jgi:hypothetical protein
LTRDYIQYKKGILKLFLEHSRLYSDSSIENSITDIVNPSTVAGALPFLIKKASENGFSGSILKGRHNTNSYCITGPFGNGLEIKKFSYGLHCLIGMGSGCNVFIDFVDYLTRKMMYDYTVDHIPGLDANSLDIWRQDLDMVFKNDVKFSFYLSFKSFKEFESIFGENIRMISEIKNAKNYNLVDKIVVRLTESVPGDVKDLYKSVTFLEPNSKIQENVFRSILCKLGATFENDVNNVGRVICAGNRKFTDAIHMGMQNAKMDLSKLLMV